jgi:O-antigen/teichoic acid export membrane protein
MAITTAFLKSSLFRTAGIYGGLNFLRQLIPFLMWPIVTRYLTPADYGTLAMFNVLVSTMYIFISLGLDGAIGREYFDKEKINFPEYVANCLGLGTLAFIILTPIVITAGPLLTKYTGVSENVFWIVMVASYCRFITQILLVIWQSGMRAMSYSTMQFSQIIADVIFTILLVVFLQQGLQGKIDGTLYTSIIFSIIALLYLLKEGLLSFRLNTEYIKMALALGIPLIPHIIGGTIISMSDRALLMNLTDATQTGLYFIAFQIGGILSMAVWAFNQAWSPWLFKELTEDKPGTKTKIVKFTYLYCIFLVICAYLLTLISPLVFKYFIGPDFAGGAIAISWVAAGAAVSGMYYIVCGYITYARKNHLLSWITIVSGLVNIGASYYLIQKNGFIGAAQGTLIANVIFVIMTWILAAKVYEMPWLGQRKK